MDQKKAAMIAAVCGALVFIGVLLPWYSVSVDIPVALERYAGSRSHSVNGTEYGNGTITLIAGLVGGIAAGLLWKGKTQGLPLNARQLAMTAVGAFGLGALLTVIDLTKTTGSYSGPGGSAGKSIGIYLTLLATLAGAGVSWVMMQKTPAPPPGATPPAAPPAAPPPAPPAS